MRKGRYVVECKECGTRYFAERPYDIRCPCPMKANLFDFNVATSWPSKVPDFRAADCKPIGFGEWFE